MKVGETGFTGIIKIIFLVKVISSIKQIIWQISCLNKSLLLKLFNEMEQKKIIEYYF